MNSWNSWMSLAAVIGLAVSLAMAATSLGPTTTATAAAGDPAAKPLRLLVGTYTDKSKGIYSLTMDPATGALSSPELAAETSNPSFLATDAAGRFVYAVNEDGGKAGSVSAFAVDANTGRLTAVGKPQTSGGTAPCHLVVDPSGKFVVAANYGSGTLEVLPIGKDGALGAPSGAVQHQGTGPNRGRQEAPHAHCVGFDPAGKVLLAADLGADKIFTYRLDETSGKLSPGAQPSAPAATAGAGPRHFAFSPSGKFLYVINELNSTVGVYAYDAARGSMTVVQSIAAGEGGGGAEIAVHPTGKFVYASVRGPNHIAIFSADATGKLTAVGRESTQGNGPRHFAIDPSGKFLIAANQDSGNLVVFQIDPATGKLKATGAKATVSKAVCILFMPPAK
jgi:6-phosphogluconolactonase